MFTKKMLNKIKFVLFFWLILLVLISLSGCEQSYTGTPVKVLVVMVKLDKQPACPHPADCEPNIGAALQAKILEPRHSATETMKLLEKEVNQYYQNASYGEMYFDFHLLVNPDSADGWWDAPHAIWQYNLHLATFQQDSVSIAYTVLGNEIDNYDRILYIQNVKERGGQTFSIHAPTPYYPIANKYWKINLHDTSENHYGIAPMIIAQVNEDESDHNLATITSHELGHTLGAPDLYGGSQDVGLGLWDVMASDWYFNHFSAWTKLDRGWINWNSNTTRMPCVTGSCSITTTLDPQEIRGNNALLIPLSSSSEFVGIMAECRKKIRGDEGIPEEGVLITLSNPYFNKTFAKTISEVATNETNPYALLQPGEVYYNLPAGVRIINLSKNGDSTCTVKAERMALEAPDVYITQGDIIQGQPYDRYKSIDIWNDTEINGWYGYPSYEKIIKVDKGYGSISVPAGYGDPISILTKNYVFFMVHNGGNVEAEEVVVYVYKRQPLSVTVQSNNCGAPSDTIEIQNVVPRVFIGVHTFYNLKPGKNDASAISFFTTDTSPLEIEVEIQPVEGELDTSNNVAYETYTHFYGHTGASVIDFENGGGMSVGVSSKCGVGIPYVAMEIPKEDGTTCDWDLRIEPSSGIILPGDKVDFKISGAPLMGAKAGESCNSTFGVMMPLTDVFTPVESFDFEARVVDPSSLTCTLSAESFFSGDPVSVTGQLTPALADVIGLQYTDPIGLRTMQNQTTQSGGQYLDVFTPTLTGIWKVQALWVGDEKHAQTSSSVCQFTIKDKVVVEEVKQPPRFTPDRGVFCRQGPSTYFGATGVTVAGIEYPILGISFDQKWYQVDFGKNARCWVKSDTGVASGDNGEPGCDPGGYHYTVSHTDNHAYTRIGTDKLWAVHFS